MKHRFIAVALLITTLLSGCGGNKATEVMSPVESQVSEDTYVDVDWHQNKVFQDSDTGFYCWVDEVKGNLCFLISGILNEDAATCVAIVKPDSYELKTSGDGDGQCLQFSHQSKDGNTIAIYEIENDQLVMIVGNSEGRASYLSGVYKRVITQQEQSTEQPYEFGEYTTLGLYECLDTGSTLTAELQDGLLVLYFPNETYIAERNGADTGWEFINDSFTNNRVYTNISIQDNELTVTSTEPWRYDGTYIQLPDMDTDGEGE